MAKLKEAWSLTLGTITSKLQQLGFYRPVGSYSQTPHGAGDSALTYLEAGFMHLEPTAPMVVLLKTLWSFLKNMLGIQSFLTHTPLWRKFIYKEVLKLEGFQEWERAGLCYIFQLYAICYAIFFSYIMAGSLNPL